MENLASSVGSGRKPEWLRKRIEYSSQRHRVKEILSGLGLNTVCEEARCPNQSECFSHRRATFLILGDKCTRNCRFCSIDKAKPGEFLGLDEDEPKRVAEAVKNLELKYVVITSVTRDDLDDGGASQFAKTIEEIKSYLDKCKKNKEIGVLVGHWIEQKGNHTEHSYKTSFERLKTIINYANKIGLKFYTLDEAHKIYLNQ